MTVVARIDHYLRSKNIPYSKVAHPLSNSSVSTAKAAQVPLNQVAKAVVLEDHQGHHLMAVLPSDRSVGIDLLNKSYHSDFHLLPESEVFRMFADCQRGAVPPVGDAYNINTVVDDEIFDKNELYFEGGDHRVLLKLDQAAIKEVFADCPHQHFSRQAVF